LGLGLVSAPPSPLLSGARVLLVRVWVWVGGGGGVNP